ncbi:hypothetical protein [Ornithinimicrobium kibberense]|uniref:hypothetical protein n=1 Tax=Ornithinimicrobium kibberense TaxID=282060 RepID=UPI003619EF87
MAGDRLGPVVLVLDPDGPLPLEAGGHVHDPGDEHGRGQEQEETGVGHQAGHERGDRDECVDQAEDDDGGHASMVPDPTPVVRWRTTGGQVGRWSPGSGRPVVPASVNR